MTTKFKLMNIDDEYMIELFLHHTLHIKDYLDLFDHLRYFVKDIVDFEYKMNEHRNQQMMIQLKDYLIVKVFFDVVLMNLDCWVMKIQ